MFKIFEAYGSYKIVFIFFEFPAIYILTKNLESVKKTLDVGYMASRKFFCHHCGEERSVNLEQWKCDTCSTGFIEEIPQTSSSTGSETRSNEPTATIRIYNQDSANPPAQPRPTGRPELYISANGDLTTTRPQQGQTIQNFINNLFAGMNIGANINPDDFAWGEEGLDNIITQLMQQVEGGAPPAPANLVDALPTVRFTEELKTSSAQCSICMTDYEDNEDVIRLSCEHFFHPDCIKDWLSHHNACPICRTSLGNSDS